MMPDAPAIQSSRKATGVRARRRRDGRRGQSMIEFALCFLLFLATVTGFAQIALALWIKSTLHHAAREGVRFAITGATLDGQGHDDSIRTVVMQRSAGLVGPTNSDLVQVLFYDQNGQPTGSNAGGNTVLVQIQDYPIPVLASPLITLVPSGLQVSVNAVDRLEPFTDPPTR